MNLDEFAYPALTGLIVALTASLLIAVTARWHGKLSLDLSDGPQKIPGASAPRIGGLAVYAGFIAATAVAAVAVQPGNGLLIVLGISGSVAFAAGLAEDVTKKTPSILRLFGTACSGLLFCLLTGYSVIRLDLPLADHFMAAYPVSIAFTIFVMTGLAHSINIIDGLHGLAAGTVLIMLLALGVVALRVGDHELVSIAIVIAAVLSGFLLVNFPFGYVFLGDGGAYLSGLFVGGLAVMLSARNPGISPWTIAVVLAYPVLDTLFSIFRKTVTEGRSPLRPDSWHLHHVVYRRFGKKLAEVPGRKEHANPIAALVLLSGAMTGLIFVLFFPYERTWSLAAVSLQTLLYAGAYLKASRPNPPHTQPVPPHHGAHVRPARLTGLRREGVGDAAATGRADRKTPQA